MTQEERWKIEGRTRDELRDAKKNLAALKLEIENYAGKLKDASENLRHFLSHPSGPGPTGMTSRQYALHFFGDLLTLDVKTKLAEFERESERVPHLEEQVKQFD